MDLRFLNKALFFSVADSFESSGCKWLDEVLLARLDLVLLAAVVSHFPSDDEENCCTYPEDDCDSHCHREVAQVAAIVVNVLDVVTKFDQVENGNVEKAIY